LPNGAESPGSWEVVVRVRLWAPVFKLNNEMDWLGEDDENKYMFCATMS
jgi:hypothetical protein